MPDELIQTNDRLSDLILGLERWYRTYIQGPGHEPTEVGSNTGSGVTVDEDGLLFKTIFEYDSLQSAHLINKYWAIMIIAIEWQHKLYDMSWQRGFNHEGMLAVPTATEIALRICRGIEYHLRPEHAEEGAFYILMSARVAFFALPRQSREALWLVRLLVTIANGSGYELARHLLNNVPIRKKQGIEG